MVALALVTYTATLTLTLSPFFVQGSNAMGLSMSTSTGTRYFPDGTGTGTTNPNGTIIPTGTTNNQNFTFATQLTGKGYVQISMSTAAKTTDFNSFKIFVLTYNGTTTKWVNATMFTAATGGSVITGGFDGTQTATSAFIRVNGVGSPIFYLIQVNYILAPTPVDATTTVVIGETPSLN